MVSTRNRDNMLEETANLIETKLTLLGATAIEDQLQDQVENFILSIHASVARTHAISYLTFAGPGNNTGSSAG